MNNTIPQSGRERSKRKSKENGSGKGEGKEKKRKKDHNLTNNSSDIFWIKNVFVHIHNGLLGYMKIIMQFIARHMNLESYAEQSEEVKGGTEIEGSLSRVEYKEARYNKCSKSTEIENWSSVDYQRERKMEEVHWENNRRKLELLGSVHYA